MAESSSPALPGDVEWLPGPDGTRVLRIHSPSADPPTLILSVSGGGERRIDARPHPLTEYSIPAEVDWSAAWLQWPDGTRAALPLPHSPHAEVIELRPRRFARSEPRDEAGWRGEIAPPVRDALEDPAESSVPSREDDPDDVSARASRSAHAGTDSPAGGAGASPAMGTAPVDGRSDAAADSPAAGAVASPTADTALAVGASRSADAGADSLPASGVASPMADMAPADDAARGSRSAGARADSLPADTAPADGAARSASAAADSLAAGADAAPAAATVGADAATPEQTLGGSWTTPPQHLDSIREAEAAWRGRRDDLRRDLAEAADAIARARDGERSARDAVLTALAAARADLRASRAARDAEASALAAVTGELGAERAAHAVTRGSVGSLADALSTARAELAAARTRAEATQAELDVARAELVAARATGAAELAQARSEVTQARSEAAALREILDAPRPTAGRTDLGRLAREQAEAAARRAPKTSPQLLANLDAAAAALRAAKPAADDGAPGEETGPGVPAAEDSRGEAQSPVTPRGETQWPAAARGAADSPATATGADDPPASVPGAADSPATATGADDPPASVPGAADSPATASSPAAPTPPAISLGSAPSPDAPRESEPGETQSATASESTRDETLSPPRDTSRHSTALVAAGEDLRLRRALLALAREDGVAAGALLIGLLPAQGAVIEGALTYDLTVRGVGTFAVFVADGSARIVRLSRRRPRSQALFHLSAEPFVLAELLAGERSKVGRFRRQAKVSGKRKRARELLLLAEARLSLADAVKAGARLEPGLVYRALPLAVDPEWTRGHTFTVAQQIVEFAPNAWHITARDGQPLRVVQRNSGTRADATVTMSQAAFERMLRDEPSALGDRPQIRGDREAVAALKRWTDLARGV